MLPNNDVLYSENKLKNEHNHELFPKLPSQPSKMNNELFPEMNITTTHEVILKNDDNIPTTNELIFKLEKNDDSNVFSNLASRRPSKPDDRKDSLMQLIHQNQNDLDNKNQIDVFKAFDYPQTKTRQTAEKILGNMWFLVIVNVFSVWCLFSDDFKLIFVDKVPGDTVFDCINLLILLFFLCEVGLNTIARRKYLGCFFFWMDLVSTLIIIFDLSWVQEAMLYV